MKVRFLPRGALGPWCLAAKLALIVLIVAGLGGVLLPACTGSSTTTVGAKTASTTETALRPSTTLVEAAQTMSWQPLSVRQDSGPISALVMDPADPATLYAGTMEGLFKSSDGAESWNQLATPVGGTYAISIDPASPVTVYAAIYLETDDARPAHLLRSEDGGATWADLSDAEAPKIGGYAPSDLAFDTTTIPSTVYIRGFDWQVYCSTDRGETWTTVKEAEQDRVGALLDATSSGAAGADALRRTQALDAFRGALDKDGNMTDAATGANIAVDITSTGSGRAIVDPDHPSILYVAAAEHVFKSLDSGETWRNVSAGLVDRVVWGLVVDPRDPSTLYAAAAGGVFKSGDGGSTWTSILFGPLGRDSVIIAPSSPSTLYAWTAAGLYRTDDDGINWTERGGEYSIPSHWRGTTPGSLVLAKADDPDTVFALTDLLSRSTTGGDSWYQIPGGASTISSGGVLVADPHTPSTLFAALPGAYGVLKSTDAGATWAALPMRWDYPVVDIAVDPHAASTVYVIKHDASAGAYVLSRSLDGGTTWQGVAFEGMGKRAYRLLFDPRSAGTMYAFTDAGDANSVLNRSTDGGATWTTITGELADAAIFEVVIDPGSTEGLYAVTSRGLFKWAPAY